MLGLAQKHGYAVGHFNTNNLEETQAIINAAVALSSPVIVATSHKALAFAGDSLPTIIKHLAQAKIPVALHLDHSPTVKLAIECIDNGYTSVMIDTSQLKYRQNVAATKRVVDYAHRRKVSVEAEIGVLKGVEDDVVSTKEFLTIPAQARRFVNDTRCDSLAIAIGTSHGAFKFKGTPRLDLADLKEIREEVQVPLVLHGASSVYPALVHDINRFGGNIKHAEGVPEAMLKKAIGLGICKINTDTDLRLAFILGCRRYLIEHPEGFDLRNALTEARAEMQHMVARKIRLFG